MLILHNCILGKIQMIIINKNNSIVNNNNNKAHYKLLF